jgi:hypothetical protein
LSSTSKDTRISFGDSDGVIILLRILPARSKREKRRRLWDLMPSAMNHTKHLQRSVLLQCVLLQCVLLPSSMFKTSEGQGPRTGGEMMEGNWRVLAGYPPIAFTPTNTFLGPVDEEVRVVTDLRKFKKISMIRWKKARKEKI